MKLCLEASVGNHIAAGHPITATLLLHTCARINARFRGIDGRTAGYKVKGRDFSQFLLGFGECMLYKLPSEGLHGTPDGNMGRKRLEGVFLGNSRYSNAYVVATANGVTTARSINRKPAENRWVCKKISAIAAPPLSFCDKADPEVRFADGAEVATDPRRREEGPLPNTFRIGHAHFCEALIHSGLHTVRI